MKVGSLVATLSLCCLGGATAQEVRSIESIEQRFEQLDQNADRKLTAKEFPRKRLFDRLDANSDGVVTLEEATSVLGRAGAARTKRDVSYGDHERQRLDLYAPKNAKSAPVMVYIHGGGWRRGDKSRVGQKTQFFTSRGWLLVSINYRLLPDGKHPNNVEDVATALAWVHENIGKHGGDPEHLFLMGHSAGAHLAALVATDPRPLSKAGKSLAILKGVIPLDTQAYDIPKLLEEREGPSLYTTVFGKTAESQRDASPAHHVAKGNDVPPFLICFSRGMGARVSPDRRKQSDLFAEKLKSCDVRAEVVDASDRNHGEINSRFGDPEDEKVTGKSAEFLNSLVPPARRLSTK